MAQVFVDTVAANRGVEVAHVLSAFGKGDVLVGAAAVEAGMADAVGTFESTLAKLAAGETRFGSADRFGASRVGMPLAPPPAPKVLAPVPPRPVVPAVSPAVATALAAERERAAALLAMTPAGADKEFRAAVRNGDSVEAYGETLATREISQALAWLRGGPSPAAASTPSLDAVLADLAGTPKLTAAAQEAERAAEAILTAMHGAKRIV